VDVKRAVPFLNARGIDIVAEFGSFHPRGADTMAAAIQMALEQHRPFFEAGGRVKALHLDGPVRRLVKGLAEGEGMTLDQIAALLIAFWRAVRREWNDIELGLITNFPNWDYTKDFQGYNGHFTDRSGLTYREVIDAVHAARERPSASMTRDTSSGDMSRPTTICACTAPSAISHPSTNSMAAPKRSRPGANSNLTRRSNAGKRGSLRTWL